MKKVLVILGPTATGKTDIALFLAKKYQGELVSCDSRQVYKGLDIGTGKEPSSKNKELRIKRENGYWEISGIKVWMYDVADPKEQFTVKDYVEQASQVVEDIIKRGKLPIIVGGTGFYLKSLLEGLPNLEIPVDEKLRGEMQQFSLEKLQEKLKSLSPLKWKSLNESDKKNPRRLLRSIELILMNPHKNTIRNLKFQIKNYNLLKVGLTAPREILQSRIYKRLVSRIDQGLIEEARRLQKGGLTLKRMEELGLEYGMLAKLLRGEIRENQFIDELSAKIRQYAKRQMTWFKNPSPLQQSSGQASSGCINWFDITQKELNQEMEKLISEWYYKQE